MTNDIHVELSGGIYVLDRTFALSGADSGRNGYHVIYEAAKGADVRLSGGRKVKGWRSAGRGVMTAPVERGLSFRQVYVGDARATRARWPDTGFLQDGITWQESDLTVAVSSRLPQNVDWRGAEFVVNRHWQQHRLRIAQPPVIGPDGKATLSFFPDDAFISFNAPGGTICQTAFAENCAKQPYYFENNRAFLDRAGEWYLDEAADALFYKPEPGQSMSDVRIPVLQTLVRLQGSATQPVHHIIFRGISFEYAGWSEPNRTGVVPIQATWLSTPDGTRYLPAAVEVRGEGANNIRFERDSFRHIGATGLAFYKTVNDVAVIQSRFEDISAGAIAVHADPGRTDFAAKGSANIEIADNLISNIGVDYTGTIGIFAGYVENARIEHNAIHDVPYTAISVGWGWTDQDNGSKNNSISYNHIYRAMQVHDDGGGIYTLSKQPGTKIIGNYIHDFVRNPAAGEWGIVAIYLDNGSEGITVRDNAIERVKERIQQNLNAVPGQSVPAKNNIVEDYAGPIAPVAAKAGPRK